MSENITGGLSDQDAAARTLVLEWEFHAPVERVYDAWTKPEYLVQWWGPEGMTVPTYEMDVREGGKWQTTMVNAAGEAYTVQGKYVTLERPTRLVMTWAWLTEGVPGHETLVEVTLQQTEAGTRLRLVQKVFDTEEQKTSHHEGWTSSLHCLERFLSQ
ncbi:SRPBCC family protein [Luteithermobacter gelatinilyticus]|uniref:SRPBCC family protein n=1 Tax=Luteithermobacter gelatinilyticus TaxID=2582913 RepID=UPI0011068780|nr:SRPBCC domain-containing protein [Luteithermobacter gelatinilyticus]